jgi:diguanylate cyclase (GGDEF)-like protein
MEKDPSRRTYSESSIEALRKGDGMRPFSLPYKALFFIGGLVFASLSYIMGTWLYTIEQYVWNLDVLITDPLLLLMQIPSSRPLTFFPWVIGTALVFVALGYLFDRQVQLRRRVEALAVTDGLTLAYNHRFFMQQLRTEIKRTDRLSQDFALLLLDIDDFKRYNDICGHLAGDDALRLVAQTIRATVRETDTVARYGGEEFVVIASGVNASQGAMLAERIRDRIAQETPATVSIGVGGYPEHGTTMNQLIEAADRAMYRAKAAGKNRVCLCSGSGAQVIDEGAEARVGGELETAKPY